MKKYGILVLALLLFSTGCNEKEPEMDAAGKARLDKIKAAIEATNTGPKPSMGGIPEAGGAPDVTPADTGEKSDEKAKPADAPKADDGDTEPDDDDDDDEAEADEGDDDADFEEKKNGS